MMCLLSAVLFFALIPFTPAPPVDTSSANATEAALGLDYERYLKEIVSVLEQDEEFRNKVQNTPVEQLKSGLIANELQFVNHNVRTQLDEIKRRELLRLRQLALKQMEQNNGRDHPRLKLPSHVNHLNPASFEVQDLAMLIKQANKDLEEADRLRRNEFKRYEMEKEHIRREKIKQLDERQRLEEIKKYEEMQKKHKQHDPLHHPGSKQQLEEVWEEADGLDKTDFDAKTFFKLHDLNQDGHFDQAELESLFQKELDKVYDPKAPEDDMVERMEEMARMREHVMKQVDTNKDGLISWDEFLSETKKKEFEQDDGWKTLDEQQQVYNEKDLEEYERLRAQEEQLRLQYQAARAQAGYQMHPNQIPHQGYQQFPQPGMGQFPQQGMGQFPQPGMGQFPQPGMGQFPQPGMGQYIQPGMSQYPHPGMGQLPQPGVGQYPQPGLGQYPQPAFQQLPQQKYQQFAYQGVSPQEFQKTPLPNEQGQLKPVSQQIADQNPQAQQQASLQSQQAAALPQQPVKVPQQVPLQSPQDHIQSQQASEQVPAQSQEGFVQPQKTFVQSNQVLEQQAVDHSQKILDHTPPDTVPTDSDFNNEVVKEMHRPQDVKL